MANKLVNELTLKDTNFTSGLKNAVNNANKNLGQLGKVGGQLGGTLGKLSGSLGSVSSALSGAMGAAGPIGAAIAGVTAFSSALSNNIQTAMQFEKSVSSMKALTGASAETMNYLKQSAIELGASTTQTASGVMNAFKLIGSKSPELLKNAGALKEVTANVIMLSEAAEMELEPAATALTGILNQFGIATNRSKEIVNLLAAASQQGAGDISYLNDAIVNCGAVAGSLNVKVNEVVAQIEQLAQAGMQASSAGNNLKNIMLTLESSTNNNLKPSVVGLNDAIANLAKENLSTTEITKMFGKENVAAALTLIKTAESAQTLTDSITGTNTAEEQQRINNDNLEGSLKALESKWEAFNLAINEGNGLIRSCVDATATLVGWLTSLITKTDEATEARKRLNRELGQGANNNLSDVQNRALGVQNQKTNGQRIQQFNREQAKYKSEITKRNKEIADLDKQIELQSSLMSSAMSNTENAVIAIQLSNLKAKRAELVAERKVLIEDQKQFVKLGQSAIKQQLDDAGNVKTTPTVTTPTTTPTTTTTTTPKTKTSNTKTDKSVDYLAGSLNDLRAQYNKLQTDLSNGVIPSDAISSSVQKMNDLKKQIEAKEIEIGLKVADESKMKSVVSDYADTLSDLFKAKPVEVHTTLPDARLQGGKDYVTKHSEKADNIGAMVGANDNSINQNNQQIQQLSDWIQKAQEKLAEFKSELGDNPSSWTDEENQAYQKLTESIEQATDAKKALADVNNDLSSTNSNLIKDYSKETKKVKNMNSAYDALGNVADILGNLGGAMQDLAGQNTGLQAFGIALYLAGAMAAMAQQLTKCVTVWDYIAAIAAGTAAVATSVMQFRQLGAHASGGFVAGGPTVGDQTVIRANRGELVINSAQQARLWKAINGSTPLMQDDNLTDRNVEFRISGNDLVGVLSNHQRKHSRI